MAYIVENRFNSKFYDFVLASNFDCANFVDLIVQNFSGFRDEAIYNGRQVFFYKRAQILCADLIGAYSDVGHKSTFENTKELTMFADYRVP